MGTTHQDNELLCGEYIVNGITYSNCRSTCHGDNCNAVTPSKKLSCYTCDVTIDINGDVMGFGDGRCASDAPPLDSSQVCNSTLCNDDMDSVTSQFSTGSDLSCYVCTYLEKDNGDIEGNRNCGSENVPDQFKKKCPVYADSGCFTGTNAHFTSSEVLVEEVYKGCSSFPYDEAICTYIDDVIVEGNRSTTYGICKEACSGDYCNVNHITPEIPTVAATMFNALSFLSFLILVL